MEAKQVPETQIHIYSRLKSMVFYIVVKGVGWGWGGSRAPHPPDATMLSVLQGFLLWPKVLDRHKEQTEISAGHSLCHCLSQAAGQSHQQPGHLVSPLPTALTWHRADCGPPAGPGSLLQWGFNHQDTHKHHPGV